MYLSHCLTKIRLHVCPAKNQISLGANHVRSTFPQHSLNFPSILNGYFSSCRRQNSILWHTSHHILTHMVFLFFLLGNFACFLSSADFFQNQLFRKICSGIPLECQAVWIQIRPDILSGLIWIQNICKGYQQTTLSRQRVKRKFTIHMDGQSCCVNKYKLHPFICTCALHKNESFKLDWRYHQLWGKCLLLFQCETEWKKAESSWRQ